MPSQLIITEVNQLQDAIVEAIKAYPGIPGIYVSLNRTQQSTESHLASVGIDPQKMFFIDCMTTDKTRQDVLHIAPSNLDILSDAIEAFINEIDGKKFMIIDAISTLLIYNDENRVAQFVKKVTEFASQNEVSVLAFSPETKGEELLDKIYNFFDNVIK